MGSPSVNIAVTTDTSQLRGQMQQAGAIVQDAAIQMTAAGKQAQASWAQVAAATLNANEASRVVKDTLRALASGEVPMTTRATDDLALAQREAAEASRQLAAAQKTVKAALGETGTAMVSARMQATMLSSTLGLGLGRGIEQIISRTPVLAGAMSAMFPMVTGLAFYELAVKIGEKLSEWISNAFIFTKEMQAAYAAEVAFNNQLNVEHDAQKDLQRQIFEWTHSNSEIKNKALDDEKARLKAIGDQIAANHAAQAANKTRAAQEASTSGIIDTEQGQMAVPGAISKETTDQAAHLTQQGQLLNEQLKSSTMRVQELEYAYKAAANTETEQAKARAQREAEEAKRRVEEAAKLAQLRLELSNNGFTLGPDSLTETPTETDLQKLHAVLEAVKKAHAGLTKDVEDEAKKREKIADDEVERFDRAQKEMHELLDLRATGQRDKSVGEINYQEQQVKGDAASGKINPSQELAQLQTLHAQEAAAERTFAQQKLDIERSLVEAKLRANQVYSAENLKIELAADKEYQKALNEQQKLEQKARMEELKDEQAQLQQREAAYKQWATQVSNSMFSGVNSWLSHQKNFTQAMKQEWNTLAMDSIKAIEQIGEKWVLQHGLMRLTSTLFHTTDLGQHSTTAAAKEAIDAASLAGAQAAQTTQLVTTGMMNSMAASSYAAVAAAAALASTAAIPIVGPALAPGVAAAMLATGEGFAAMAAFELGGVVPKTQVAMVHGGERVLTGRQNSFFEQMVNQSTNTTNSRSGGDMHYHDNRKVSAWDGASAQRATRRNSKGLSKEISRAFRLGKLGN